MSPRAGGGAYVWATAAALTVLACTEPASQPEAASGRPEATSGQLVPVNGTEIFVRRLGTGDPVIVIHGGPVLDHGYLLPHLEPLGARSELVFYDQRLSGRSAPRVDSASVRMQTFVDDIEALRQQLGLGPVHLLAHSWGGLLALNYALDHPEGLRSLILVSPMPPSAMLWRDEQQAVGALVTPADSAAMARARASDGFSRGEPPAIEAALMAAYRVQFYDRTHADGLTLFVPADYYERSRQFGFMMPDLVGYDLTDRLSEIEVPALVVYGSAEPSASLSGEVLAATMPNATLEQIDEAGHFAFVERPEAFLALVGAFLAEHRTASP